MGELFNSPHEWTPADLRAPDRLHPHPRHPGRRPHALPQDRRARRNYSASEPPGTAPATYPPSATPPTSPSTSPATTSASRNTTRSTTACKEVFRGCPVHQERLSTRPTKPPAGASKSTKSSPRKIPLRRLRARRPPAPQRRLGRNPQTRRHGDQPVGRGRSALPARSGESVFPRPLEGPVDIRRRSGYGRQRSNASCLGVASSRNCTT